MEDNIVKNYNNIQKARDHLTKAKELIDKCDSNLMFNAISNKMLVNIGSDQISHIEVELDKLLDYIMEETNYTNQI